MKLAYQTVGVPGGYVTIYDEAQGPQPSQFDPATNGLVSSPEWHPHAQALAQNDDLFGLPNTAGPKFRQALGNAECTVTARFVAPYPSRVKAKASIRTWQALLQQSVHFQLTEDTDVDYYPNAVVSSVDDDLQGTTVVHTISFTSDLVTLVAP